MMRIQEGSCVDVAVQINGRVVEFGQVEEWLEVDCVTHRWECGHRHTKWGPVLRCITRHVASMIEEEE